MGDEKWVLKIENWAISKSNTALVSQLMVDNLGPVCYRYLNNSFLVLKQHYMYFHTLFHSHAFSKIQTTLLEISYQTGNEKLWWYKLEWLVSDLKAQFIVAITSYKGWDLQFAIPRYVKNIYNNMTQKWFWSLKSVVWNERNTLT